jgi:predicted permease
MPLLQDLRYGFRQLRKSPAFTLTAVLTLALGIGATTALFSVVDGVLLKPLAYRDSGRLVAIWERVRFLQSFAPYLGPNSRHEDIWRRQADDFRDITILQQNSVGVGLAQDHPRYVGRVLAQPNLLDVLGIQPILGRNFLPEETTAGRDNVVILSSRIWQSLFHGDPSVLGKTIQVAGRPCQIIGILPPSFYFPRPDELSADPEPRQLPNVDILQPLVIDTTQNYGWNSDYGNYTVLAHLKPGISVANAEAQLNGIAEDIARQIPPNQIDGPVHGALGAYVQPLKQAIVGRTAPRLWLLLAAVLCVLLIACVNLANAQLARFVSRDREAALRSALGASSAQLLGSALAEVGILALTGGILGIALAVTAVHRFAAYTQIAIPRSGVITINFGVLAVSVLLTVGAAVIFGVLPALRLLRVQPQSALQGSGRSTGSRRGNLLRRSLVTAQVFACTTLLIVAGLFARSLIHLSTQDKGFSTAHVLAADVDLHGDIFTDQARIQFNDAVLEKLRAVPGVQSASLVNYMLLAGEAWMDDVNVAGKSTTQSTLANYRWIGPDYFATLQERVLEGREFDARDRTLKSAVISQATARAVWPNQDAIGRQFTRNGATYTVVGIAADARNNALRSAPVTMVYLPYWDDVPYRSYFLIRSQQDPASLTGAVRNAIWSYNPSVTIARVHTLDETISDSLAPEHLQTAIFAAFGAAALLLALLGIYGTLSYAVESRTQEVGVRMALGATRASVYWLMLAMIVAPVFIGLTLGWIASLAIGRSITALLYGTSPSDLSVTIPVLLIFAFAAILATWVPCRRASRIEPMQALRTE